MYRHTGGHIENPIQHTQRSSREDQSAHQKLLGSVTTPCDKPLISAGHVKNRRTLAKTGPKLDRPLGLDQEIQVITCSGPGATTNQDE